MQPAVNNSPGPGSPCPPMSEAHHANLRSHTLRGGAITAFAQVIRIILNFGSTMILARMLTPEDYGLIAMVAAFTGFVEILKDGGLSLATVQSEHITGDQISTLFWLNAALGCALALVTIGLAPVVTHFYGEPRLTGITVAIAGTFLLSGLTVQHQALLRRNLRFTALAVIDMVAVITGLAVGVVMAELNYGYRSLLAMAICSAAVSVCAVWIMMPWRPGRIRFDSSVRPMIGFGGNIIVTRFLHSFIRHLPNLLLGWCWGPATVGIYQRAYTLVMFAVDQIQGTVSSVIMSPLSRLQNHPARLKEFFLTGYRIIVSAILPVVTTCAIFAEEVVFTVLGAKWHEAAPVFRWLALSGIFIGLLHPQGILLLATGRTRQCAKMVLADAVGMLAGYLAGLKFGAAGVAVGFLGAKLVLTVPLTLETFRDTPVSWRDILDVAKAPIFSTAVAAIVSCMFKELFLGQLGPRTIAIAGCSISLLVYVAVLFFGVGQWGLYRSMLVELRAKKITTQAA